VDWNFFVQLLVNGVTLGSVYALIALGYSMVYGILKLLNFAHGEVYMIGAFIGYGILQAFGGPVSLTISVWLLMVLMVLAAMIGCGVLGVVIERFAYRPLRNAPRIAPLISALGVSFFLQNTVLLLFGANFRSYEAFSISNGDLFAKGIHTSVLNISLMRIIVIGSALVLMVGLTILVARSRMGKAMRATAYDREAAAMMGIDVDRVILFTFFVGSALAGAAGVMVGLLFSQINHFMGFLAGLKGFTAAVVGGIGSIPGAMVGGLLIGITESMAQGYNREQFPLHDIFVFVLLIVVMLVRPHGLFGKPNISKV
jgi:branched-chain amino acid transport system permease protein